MDEVITKIEANKDEKNELDVANILYEFALEAIGIAYKFTLKLHLALLYLLRSFKGRNFMISVALSLLQEVNF